MSGIEDNLVNVGGIGGVLVALFLAFMSQHKSDMKLLGDKLDILIRTHEAVEQKKHIESYIDSIFEQHERATIRKAPFG